MFQEAGMNDQERNALLAALAAQIDAVQSVTADHHGRQMRLGPGPVGLESAAPSADLEPTGAAESPGGDDTDRSTREAERSIRELTASARAICLRLLTVAPRPRAGLAQALERKEIPNHVAEAVLDRLTDIGLIDDAAYARSFVRVKHRDRALGRTALRHELRKLGVDEESMAAAVETLDGDAERSRAAELVAKRVDAAMVSGVMAARRRLLGLLSRRGYGPDVAIPVVERALEDYAEGVQIDA